MPKMGFSSVASSGLEELRRTAEKQLEEGKMSLSQYNGLMAIVARVERAETKADKRARLREAERYVIGRQGHPNVQGGLPSLGKRAK